MILRIAHTTLLYSAFAILVEVAKGASHDYVIIGGGLAGLVVANRLSEDPHRSVLVLEAGNDHLNDSIISIPGNLFEYLGNPEYDWAFPTVPQKHSNNITNVYSRGKGLGGSSQINYLVMGRPASGEVDAWERLGNKGWNWTELWKYVKKAERFEPPGQDEARTYNYTYVHQYHGFSGNIQYSYSKWAPTVQHGWLTALARIGLKSLKDGLGGKNVGAWYTPDSADQKYARRSYSNPAYYVPVKKRQNLQVVTGAFVSRILTGKSHPSHAKLSASGVEYYVNGTRHVANATHEVILSAGALSSPKILELSGIGDPRILRRLGIPTAIDLAGVGDGTTDHLGVYSNFELKSNQSLSLDDREVPSIAAQQLKEYRANGTGIFSYTFNTMAMAPLQTLTNGKRAGELIDQQRRKRDEERNAGLKQLKSLQLEYLLQPDEHPLLEFAGGPAFNPTTGILKDPTKKYYSVLSLLLLPWSRGTVHAQSTNYTVPPRIDPGFLTDDFDLEAIVDGVRFVQKMMEQPEWKEGISAQVAPPSNASDSELREYVKNHCTTPFHTTGSTKMLPRELGGVVSPDLIVYGTTNLRVVDLGIMPMQITNHPQSTMYGIAEKASDIIRGVRTVH